jgi:hypothetical protein
MSGKSKTFFVSWKKYKKCTNDDFDENDNYQLDIFKYWNTHGREGFNSEFDSIFKCSSWGDKFGEAVDDGNSSLARRIYEEFKTRHVDIRGPIWIADNQMWINFDHYIHTLFSPIEFPDMEENVRFELLDLMFEISEFTLEKYEYIKKGTKYSKADEDEAKLYDKYLEYIEHIKA